MTDTPQTIRPPSRRPIIAALLLFLGLQLWLIIGRNYYGTSLQLKLLAAAFVLALIPPVRRPVTRALDGIRSPSPTTRLITAIVIAALSTAYFVLNAYQQGAELHPHIHDESAYLIQTRMLLHGHLWMPSHPLADFFDSFHILVRPVY